jgi:hypothetical protein
MSLKKHNLLAESICFKYLNEGEQKVRIVRDHFVEASDVQLMHSTNNYSNPKKD